MSDQCVSCLLQGDYYACIQTECFHHENWINKIRIARIKKLEEALGNIKKLPDYRIDEAPDIAFEEIHNDPPEID